MDEREMLDALFKGAILHVDGATGEAKITTLDDLDPKVRVCWRATMEHDWDHQRQCSECLEDEARITLLDAASHRNDGNQATALELEDEARELLKEAARLREAQEAQQPRSSLEPGPPPAGWPRPLR